MGSREYARRDVLKVSAGLASAAAVGLSGCSEFQSGDGAAKADDGDEGGASVAADVPARANVVVETDFQALLEDDALRGAVNDGLSEGMQNSDMPTSVEEVFDSVEQEAGVDPRELQQTVLFGEGSADDYDEETQYAGYLVYSNWSGDVIRQKIEDLREESDGMEVQTESYGGQTVYVSESDSDYQNETSRLVVFDDGTTALGGGGAVHDVIDVRNGDAESISGNVLDAWNAAREGHVRFAFDVDPSELPEEQSQMSGANIENVEYTYGSIYPDGDVRGIEFNVEVGSEAEAQEAVSAVEEGLQMAGAEAEDEAVRRFIEETEVTTDGSTVTVRNEVSVDEIVPVVREFVRGFVTGFTGGSVSESEYGEDSSYA